MASLPHRAAATASRALAAMLLGALANCHAPGPPAPPPNVVVVLVDDLGWRDVGVYGQDVARTPRIDAFAREGMLFEAAYAANPVCSPTRAALLTGKYPARVNINDWIPGTPYPNEPLAAPIDLDQLPLEHTTTAEALRARGYATFHVGKWHLGGEGFLPEDQGFDVNWMGRGTGHPASHFHPYGAARDGKPAASHEVRPLSPDSQPGEYLADRQVLDALELVRGAVEAHRPFYLYLPLYTVHTPIEAKPEDVERHRSLRAARIAAAAPEERAALESALPRPAYAAMLENLDSAMGALLDGLRELGVERDTIVVFTSDNGGLSQVTDNRPLRGGKRSLWEGGIRVPLLVRWPGVVAPGSRCAEPVVSQDVHATLCDLSGAPIEPEARADSRSLVSLLDGSATKLDREALYWHFPQYEIDATPPRGAVRRGDWKLIESYADRSTLLYDLRGDPSETHDLSAERPDIARELVEQLRAWRRSVGAAMPEPREPVGR